MYKCVSACGYVHTTVGALGGPKYQIPLELELQMAVSS